MLKQEKVKETSEYELDITLKRLGQCIHDIDKNVTFTQTGQLFFNCLLEEYGQLLEQSVLQNV
jgi:hypothetical protein